jgi:hypothetical protein
MNQAKIAYHKIDGKLKVVSAYYVNSEGRDYILKGMIDKTYNNDNEILMAVQELLSWAEKPGTQIVVYSWSDSANLSEFHVATIQLNPYKSKPTINSDVLIRLIK